MLSLLKDAVEAHNAELAALLAGGREKMHFILETEDFGVTWRAQKNKIPAFAMCTGESCCGWGSRQACGLWWGGDGEMGRMEGADEQLPRWVCMIPGGCACGCLCVGE